MVELEITLLHELSVKYALPVTTLTVISSWQVTPETVTLPVVTERSSAPAEIFSTQIFPVLVFILTNFETDAQKLTSPVLVEILTFQTNSLSVFQQFRCFR